MTPARAPHAPQRVGVREQGLPERASRERQRSDEPEQRAQDDDREDRHLAERCNAELHENERQADPEQQAAEEAPDWMPANHEALPSMVVPPACGRELQMSAAPATAISTASQNGRVATGLPVSWNQPLPSQCVPPSPSMVPDT